MLLDWILFRYSQKNVSTNQLPMYPSKPRLQQPPHHLNLLSPQCQLSIVRTDESILRFPRTAVNHRVLARSRKTSAPCSFPGPHARRRDAGSELTPVDIQPVACAVWIDMVMKGDAINGTSTPVFSRTFERRGCKALLRGAQPWGRFLLLSRGWERKLRVRHLQLTREKFFEKGSWLGDPVIQAP